MRSQLKDPELRRRVWPDYTFGCKRILFSSSFLPALAAAERRARHATPIAASRPRGSRPPTARAHELDCIIWATGFRTNDFMFPMEITGRDGRDLRESWAAGRTRTSGCASPGSRTCSSCTGRTRTPRAARSSSTWRPRPPTCARRCSTLRAARRRGDRGARRGRGRQRPRAAGTASRAPPGRSATPGTATRTAGSSPTGRATCASTCEQRGELRCGRVPVRAAARARGGRGRLRRRGAPATTT